MEELVLKPDAPGDLVEFNGEMAQIRMPSGETIWILQTPEQALYPRLRDFLATLVKGRTLARARVVLLGGDEAVQQELLQAQPGRFRRGELKVHHLRRDGTWWHGPGKERFPDVLLCLERGSHQSRPERFDDGSFMFALSSALQKGRARQEEMHQFRNDYQKTTPWVTYTVMGFMLLSFGCQLLFGGSTYTPTLFRMGANVHGELAGDFAIWRWLSSMFLHAGVMHLAFNSYVVYALGAFLERILGPARYGILVVLSGLAGSAASYALGDGALSVGASGAFWGFLGASAALGLRPGVLIPPLMVGHLKRVAMFNLILNLGVSFLPRIDMWAHFGGGILGFTLLWTGVLQWGLGPVSSAVRENPKVKYRVAALASLLGLATLGCIAMAWTTGQPWTLVEPANLTYKPFPGGKFEVAVPKTWQEERLNVDAGGHSLVGYGNLVRDTAQVRIEISPLGLAKLSADERGAALGAIRNSLDEQPVPQPLSRVGKVEWVDGEIPFLRSRLEHENGYQWVHLVRLTEGFRQDLVWESLPTESDRVIVVQPETILSSIRWVDVL